MSDATPTRTYRSPRREESARQTRAAILEAAAELFIANGYGGTSVDAIAERAGVSKPTVFTAVGNKATVLKVARDVAMAGDDEPVPVMQRPAYVELLADPDPYRTVRRIAALSTGLLARYAALDEVLHGAADSDAELRELWAASEAQRLAAARTYVANLAGKGPLRPGLALEAAADLLWLHIAPSNYFRLAISRGWSDDRFEQWLGDAVIHHLLPVPPPTNKEKNQ
ncbi:MAG TPA: helix-turn-helix domain-containing protein [Acidimicrobiales bacterium]|nr:helix-turn-helix domain-containing protein [Acidimicrobiales bacterium]